MTLCEVLGDVIATAKHPAFASHKLLIVQPLDEKRARTGKSFLAVDHAQAGVGDVVLVMREGTGVRQILKDKSLPIRSIVVGVVDAVEVG